MFGQFYIPPTQALDDLENFLDAEDSELRLN